jgi:hypothetical protein
MPSRPRRVELEAVGDLRLRRRAEARRPVAVVVFEDEAPCVSARVGRVIPGAGGPVGPVQELGSRVVRVAVVVEEVADSELSDRKSPAAHRPPAGDLVGVLFHALLVISRGERLLQHEASEIDARLGVPHPEGLAVGEPGDAQSAAQTAAAGELRIDVELRALPEPRAEKEGRRDRRLVLRVGAHAVLAGVGRIEVRVPLSHRRHLHVERERATRCGGGVPGVGVAVGSKP